MSPDRRPATTVDEVLADLDRVIDDAIAAADRIGYFAALYHQVTARVRDGIQTGFFDDGPRMERLDVTFANRYLDALHRWRSGARPTRSWQASFEAAALSRPLIVQQLLVGINAHINLDLGIAAAETSPGAALPGLRRDFDRINEILAGLIDGIEEEISGLSPWIGWLERVGGRHDDVVIRFSIEVARSEAWRFAVELAPLARDDWGGPIGSRDAGVARLARRVLHPGWLSAPLAVIRARESNDVRRNIEALRGVAPPELAVVEARVRQERSPR